MDNADIIRRFDGLVSERRSSVEQIWELIEKFVVPYSGDFYAEKDTEGALDWHRREIYDATAVYSAQSLAASIHSNLTSPGQQWFDLRFRDEAINDNDEAKEWLEDCVKRIGSAIQESNFNVEIAEAYMDLVSYGTSALTEEVDPETNKINFTAIPVKEIFFEEDHKKQVHKLYRRLQWTPVQIVSKFGEENVPNSILEKALDGDSAMQRMDVIFCIYPRKDKKDVDTSMPLADKNRPFGYKYILKDEGVELEEGGFYEMPSYVTRWSKTSNSKWGNSPSSIALSDILMLNQVKEATMEAAGKAIDPANLAEESAMLGDLDLDRGGLTIVSDINGIRPYESGTKFDVSNMEINMLQDSIRKGFHIDQLELKESPAMTATEVNVRYEMIQKLLGSTFGRLKTDLLDPLIQRTFNIMYRSEQLMEVPQSLDIAEMDIEYTGPLARSQKVETAMAIENFISSTAGMAEIFPEALDIIDLDKAIRDIAKHRGVPATALKAQTEIDEMRDQRKEQQEQQEKMMQAQAGGEVMQSVGKGMQDVGAATEGMGEGEMQQMVQQMGGQQ